MNYTDSTKIKDLLQRDLTSYETDLLTTLLPAIKTWIDNWTGSRFDEVDSSTRLYEGGTAYLDIDPCTSITEVKTVANDGTTSQIYTLGTQYTLEPQNENVKREIVRRYGCWPKGLGRVSVTAKFSEYDGGIPYDIQFIATRLAASLLRGSKNDAASGGIKSESLEGHSISYTISQDEISSIATGDPLIKSVLEQRTEVVME